jgi:hypothetical protein
MAWSWVLAIELLQSAKGSLSQVQETLEMHSQRTGKEAAKKNVEVASIRTGLLQYHRPHSALRR